MAENFNPLIPNIPTEEDKEKIKEKFEKLKGKVDDFVKKALKSYKKEIIGVEILPPRIPDPNLVAQGLEKPVNKDQIDVLVVLDDSKDEVQPNYKMKDKISAELIKIGNTVDKNLYVEPVLVSELKEACFDSRYEILQEISIGVIVYDPMDWLGALKIAEVHKMMTLKKFERYVVSYVAAGSLFRGEKSNDIDVYVVIDDTDVRRMPRIELKEKLRSMIYNLGFQASDITGVKKQFHIQTYILTDFWESVKEAHPVIFTFLRDGVPLYDRGVYNSWRLLLKMGRIKPSPESIDMHLDLGEKLIQRSKNKLITIVLDELFYAALNPSQAALMMYGVNPPTPKETVRLMDEIFVKREKILEKKYVDTLERLRKFFKDVEHANIKYVTGTEIDSFTKDVQDYLARINKLFKQIQKKKEKEEFNNLYDDVIKITEEVLKTENLSTKTLVPSFKTYSAKKRLPNHLVNILKEVLDAKKNFGTGKITKPEIDKISREASTYLRYVSESLQRKVKSELEKCTIKFRHGTNKLGEVYILGNEIYVIDDIKDKNVKVGTIDEKGNISNVKKIKVEELDDKINNMKNIPEVLFLKNTTVNDLKKMFGEEFEVILR